MFKIELISSIVLSLFTSFLFFGLGFLMKAVEPIDLSSILIHEFSIFAFVIGILLLFVCFLLFLDRFIILMHYFLLYKFGESHTLEVDTIYSASHIQRIGKGRFYLTCKYWTLDEGLILLESDIDKTGYLKKVTPKTVKVYMSKRNYHRYFVDLPIKI